MRASRRVARGLVLFTGALIGLLVLSTGSGAAA